MIYTVQNKQLVAKIDSKGAMLRSLVDSSGVEYIWQRDPNYWNLSDINIFPYVARLTDETYSYGGKRYKMGIHGFLWQTELSVVAQTESSITFELKSSIETRAQYPFSFTFRLTRAVVGNRFVTTYVVKNEDDKTMYFGVGGHPAFKVPLETGEHYQDYAIGFASDAKPLQVAMSDDCFVLPERTPFVLNEANALPLEHELFDNDAIILTAMGSQAQLIGTKGSRVTLDFEQMQYLGLWHMPSTDAGYICIEPWRSLPSRKGVIEDLEEQPDLVALPVGEQYENQWGITVEHYEQT